MFNRTNVLENRNIETYIFSITARYTKNQTGSSESAEAEQIARTFSPAPDFIRASPVAAAYFPALSASNEYRMKWIWNEGKFRRRALCSFFLAVFRLHFELCETSIPRALRKFGCGCFEVDFTTRCYVKVSMPFFAMRASLSNEAKFNLFELLTFHQCFAPSKTTI